MGRRLRRLVVSDRWSATHFRCIALRIVACFGLLLAAIGPLHALPAHVGSETCRTCHAATHDAWRGSHHGLAMQPATAETVLGDFADVTVEHAGVETRFFRRGDAYWVETEAADGSRKAFEIAYTFGAVPLQQYLIGFPDGRYQALTVAWDTRPVEAGGQRWFHLYPNEAIPPGDELHWTAPAHTWNFACAECHSTNLQKGYDAAQDTYRTTWSEINVACEACHGAGGDHVAAAAAAREAGLPLEPSQLGLTVALGGPGRWHLAPDARIATFEEPSAGVSEVEHCGRCHARRSQITDDYEPGHPLSHTHRVQLLNDRYYHADGQILDEVFVYGSFKQSLMHVAGVTCSDCHEPHSLRLRAEGDGVCTACHANWAYATPDHHYHPLNTATPTCVDCHMPARTYMVVDPRRDHSFRIPRPDLSVAIGVPNACTQCHADRTDDWAARAAETWYGADRNRGRQRFAAALHAGRTGAPGAGEILAALAVDTSAPAIARATALQGLARYLAPDTWPAVQAGLSSGDPLMRRAAVESLQPLPAHQRWQLLKPLLTDPMRNVRLAAAAALVDLRPAQLPETERSILERGFAEYVASEQFNADRAEHWVNLARFHGLQGDVVAAETHFAEARRRNRHFVPAYVNQADLYRALGREEDGERLLREGLTLVPTAPSLHHALGLLLVRTERRDVALESLAAAHRLGADQPQYGYTYGVALDSAGDREQAIEVWEDVVAHAPNHPPTRQALAVALLEMGEPDRALPHAEHLLALMPNDSIALQLFRETRKIHQSPR